MPRNKTTGDAAKTGPLACAFPEKIKGRVAINAKRASVLLHRDPDYRERKFYTVFRGTLVTTPRWPTRLRDPEWAALLQTLRAEGQGWPFIATRLGTRRHDRRVNAFGSLTF